MRHDDSESLLHLWQQKQRSCAIISTSKIRRSVTANQKVLLNDRRLTLRPKFGGSPLVQVSAFPAEPGAILSTSHSYGALSR